MPFPITPPGPARRSRPVSRAAVLAAALVVSAGCAGGAAEAPARYTTVLDLGTAVRDRLAQDQTVGFTFRMDGDAYDVNLSGDGAFRIDPAEVSSRYDILQVGPSASGATPQMEQRYEMRTFGGEVYLREGSATWETLDLTTGGRLATLLPFNSRWMTRLPAVAGAFDLDGVVEEQRDSGQVVEYRLSGGYLEATTLALRDLRLPPPEVEPGTPAASLTVDLAVDGSDRLVSARVALLVEGEQITFDYDFRDWGEPVEIEPPPVG